MAIDDLVKRVPPHNDDAERACIGAMMQSSTAISTIMELLIEEDFFDEKNRIIFKAIEDLSNINAPADAVSVSEKLSSAGNLQKVGGSPYIAKLIENVPSLSNVSYYAKIVQDKSILRALINASRTIIDNIYEILVI